jgi:hypothetical protein
MNASRLTSSGQRIDADPVNPPGFMSDGGWCSVRHQYTEKCTSGMSSAGHDSLRTHKRGPFTGTILRCAAALEPDGEAGQIGNGERDALVRLRQESSADHRDARRRAASMNAPISRYSSAALPTSSGPSLGRAPADLPDLSRLQAHALGHYPRAALLPGVTTASLTATESDPRRHCPPRE